MQIGVDSHRKHALEELFSRIPFPVLSQTEERWDKTKRFKTLELKPRKGRQSPALLPGSRRLGKEHFYFY